ncbi:FtsX-like permease family protein [Actinoallomurus rhizosphaericola]|uniref:FtsX-like permease family protein n=1 Tax=Actinoallomurus rhizosphaericola TaxID=2952536 RepID=UPI00209360D6|nr:ABC transporter permease [Actinoallomurus rhizosphaericola]MCO5998002.1 ABC transporter permease [Actinoallomurus rhizosphaericola]
MRGLVTVLRRGLAARRVRTATTATAIAAAVAFLSGTYVLTDTIDAGVHRSVAEAAGGVSAIVTEAGGFGGSLFGGTTTIRPGLVAKVRGVSGVSAAEGVAAGYAMPLDRRGHAVSSSAAIGVSAPADPRLRQFALREGHWPRGADEAAVDATTAGTLHLAPGRTLRVALAGGARTFTVSGVVGFGSAGTIAGVSVVAFTPEAAPGLLGTGGRYAAVAAAGEAGVPAAALARRIKAAVGAAYTVRTGSQQADRLAGDISGATSVIGAVLGAFAVIALIVATLLIANTFTITVAQRTRELALLRCVGASRGQTARLVLLEAAAIGLAGGVAGLFGGIGLAAGLRASFGALGLPLPAAAPVLRAHTVVASLVVGVGVTVVAAGAAALRASRSRPLAALSAGLTATGTRPPGWTRRIVATGVLLAGAFLLVTTSSRGLVALGALALLVGAGLAGPMLVRPLTAPARRLLPVAAGVCGRLADRQMLRNPRRVAGTGGTLAVAVATVSIVATLAATITSSRALDVRRSLRADYVLSTTPGTGAGLDPALTGRIERSPGVRSAAGMPCGIFRAPGNSDKLCGIDPEAYPRLVDPHVRAGSMADLGPGTMAVSAVVAGRLGWRLGQTIPITFPVGGTRPTRIVALYDYEEVAGAYLIPLADYAGHYPPDQQADQTILVRAAGGARQQVRAELTALRADYPQATLDDRTGYGHRAAAGIDLLATMMTGLLALSLLIGLITVAIALALSVLERTREIGLLRAVGAEARQIRVIIRAEALATVVTGSLTGVVLGLAIGWPLARALNGRVFGPPGVPVPLLAVVLPAAVVAGLLAAAVPARRAARLNVLTALHAE